MGNNVERPVRCPHCKKLMVWSLKYNDWHCPECGYTGLREEHVLDYATPPSKDGGAVDG